MSSLPSNPSKSLIARNPHLYGSMSPSVETLVDPSHCHVEVGWTTDEARLNKTERAYYEKLKLCGHAWVGVQCITFKLGDDLRYTPDFIVLNAGKLEAHEVKGFMRDDALVKLKTAARMFRWLQFIVVKKSKAGWQETPIKP